MRKERRLLGRALRFVTEHFSLYFTIVGWMLYSCTPTTSPSSSQSRSPSSAQASGRQTFQTSTFYTKEMNPSPTGYGGGVPYDKLERYPQLKLLYSGSGFAKEYREDRSHTFAWEDLVHSMRVTEKTPGSCISCKTSGIEKIFNQEGWGYATRKMPDYVTMGLGSIGCTNCHDPKTYQLRVVQPGSVVRIVTCRSRSRGTGGLHRMPLEVL